MKIPILFFSFIPALFLLSKEPIDLEERVDDFVLETKRLAIPGYPGAFNPSITRYQGSLLMSFRVRDKLERSTFEFGMIWLDEEFNFISQPQILEIRDLKSVMKSQRQDPRLITIGNDLFIVYSDFTEGQDGKPTRRVFFAQLHLDENQFYINTPERITAFDGQKDARWEKNWTPFEYEGKMLLSYKLVPHKIFYPSVANHCELIAHSKSLIDWDWGDLRGGTPALLQGDHYLAFFHSSKVLETAQSDGKKIPHYVMGAYTFDAQLPFAITRISKEPIIGRSFYNGPSFNTWKPVRVVFPGGYISSDDFIWVVYGKQDFEVWVAKLDKKGLYKSLVPVNEGSSF